MDDSLQKQLEERRRRLEANRRGDAEPMDVDSEFADNRHEIEQQIVSLSSREHELQTELQRAHDDLAANRARLGVLRQAEARQRDAASRPISDGQAPASEAPLASAPSPELTQEEKDYEIALLLQRQMERELAEEDRAQREAAQPQQQSGGRSAFSFSYSTGPGQTLSFSSSDPNATNGLEEMMGRFGVSHEDPMTRIERELFGGFDRPMGLRPRPFDSFFGPTGPMSPREQRGIGPIGLSPFMFGPVGPFGIGGLNVDLDNMDHDQILRLQEMIGHVPRGASAQQISELPTSQYHSSQTEDSKDENDERRKCSICLEQFEEGEEIRTLPCFHIFHADEIDKWLQQNSVCPICRVPIQSRDQADAPAS